MTKLSTAPTPSEKTMKAIEKFVCEYYFVRSRPNQRDCHQPKVVKLYYVPIIRSRGGTTILWQTQTVPSPENYGWEKHDNRWLLVMTKLPPAPEAIIHLVE